ncbi:hypothetical protein GGD38_001421 [Chitinophagaceae bacterium OAS944]|nr:hypothetical protein [Chitinophagaceae bacterium OAS944]
MAVIQWLEYSQSSFGITWSLSDILDFALQSYALTHHRTNVFGKTYTHVTPNNTGITIIS